nr:MAG TPA: Protein of unknown function (DUF1265) [Caudoviricetes sp.]
MSISTLQKCCNLLQRCCIATKVILFYHFYLDYILICTFKILLILYKYFLCFSQKRRLFSCRPFYLSMLLCQVFF